MPKVAILLACYNGEKYLDAQISSIVEQSNKNWVLVVRDDGSSDDTVSIILRWQKKDKRILILKDDQGASGAPQHNFALLMQYALTMDTDIFCFSDQDDVWIPEKIQVMLQHYETIASDNCPKPFLLHSDLVVVDQDLRLKHPSFIDLNRLDLSGVSHPARLLTRNEVTGCAVMFNRALLELATPVPPDCVMHDWWLALISGYCGKIQFIERQLVKYRQHGNNAVGAKPFFHMISPLKQIRGGWSDGNKALLASIRQAKVLRTRFDTLGLKNIEEVELFSSLDEMTIWSRLMTAVKLPIWRSYWFLNFVLLLRLMTI